MRYPKDCASVERRSLDRRPQRTRGCCGGCAKSFGARTRKRCYYRELFARVGFDPNADFTFDDFARLPVLDREDVHRAGQDLVSSRGLRRNSCAPDATGGSTGKPTEVWLGPEERGWSESGAEAFMRRDRPARRQPHRATFGGIISTPWHATALRERYQAFESNTTWFDCFRLSPGDARSLPRGLRAPRPACIIAYADALSQPRRTRGRAWLPADVSVAMDS